MNIRHAIAITSLLALFSCARQVSLPRNEDENRFFESWISYYHPAAERTPLGAYVISETAGSGDAVGDSLFISLDYTSWTLDGELNSTTSEAVARQNRNYSKPTYYGPISVYRGEALDNLPAGLEEAVASMNIGGSKTVAIPGWLSKAVRYKDPGNYLKKCSGTDLLYSIEIRDAFNDIARWEKDSLARFMARKYPDATEDPDMEGFYYICLSPGDKTAEFSSDDPVYINYIGRLLNGNVFDTTIKDTATVWKIESSSTTYGPRQINWYDEDSEDYTAITMGSADNSSDIITGIAYALSKMHPGEKGICFFWSGMGYSYTGSGARIPAYSPLSFEIEMTEDE